MKPGVQENREFARAGRDARLPMERIGAPWGGGAGYAGGITSAAVDGIRVVEAVAKG